MTLEIGFFFDGTGNNLLNSDRPMPRAPGDDEERSAAEDRALRVGTSYGNEPSNVALLSRLYSNRETPNWSGGTLRRRGVYLDGIGTTTSRLDSGESTAFGTGQAGVSERVRAACQRLRAEATTRPTEIIVDVFGFSRGAAAARYFANCLARRSFERVSISGLFGPPVVLGRIALPRVTVRFVGIFDTVAAIGYVDDDGDVSDADNADVNVHLRPDSAETVHHLIAANEYRKNFALNSIRGRGSTALPAEWREIALPGAHSDVGGGYRGRGETVVCVEPVSERFATDAEAQQAQRAYHHRCHAFSARMVRELYVPAARRHQDLRMGYDSRMPVTHPDGGPPYQYEAAFVWRRPGLRLGLSRIPLHLMHKRAQECGVPFDDIPSTPRFQIPDDLLSLHRTLDQGRDPSRTALAHAHQNYAHWSCHWGRKRGANPRFFSAPPAFPDIGLLAPADNFERIVHPNQQNRAERRRP
ncbi:MAG: DUF2235 domain-containing protein [Myxococcota bacterium]